jgi:hypothetical protein
MSNATNTRPHTIDETAARLHLSVAETRRRIFDTGAGDPERIPAVKIGRVWYVPANVIDRLIEEMDAPAADVETLTHPAQLDTPNACTSFEKAARSYGFTGDIHTAIDLLCRAARTIAPRTAESALDTGNTDVRPEGGRKADAWDLMALAHALNTIAGEAGK